MKRQDFIKTCLTSSSLLILPGIASSSSEDSKLINLAEIKEFVFAAHKDLDKTQKMLENNPLLLNASNQAKKGDFETALGGASHMGRKDIADLLVARGARMDIFNLTFLGFTKQVKNMIKKYPHYLTAPGPHGFTLLHHANVGKHIKFAKWLKDQGLLEGRFTDAF